MSLNKIVATVVVASLLQRFGIFLSETKSLSLKDFGVNLSKCASTNQSKATNMVISPLLNVIASPDHASKPLKLLGMHKRSTGVEAPSDGYYFKNNAGNESAKPKGLLNRAQSPELPLRWYRSMRLNETLRNPEEKRHKTNLSNSENAETGQKPRDAKVIVNVNSSQKNRTKSIETLQEEFKERPASFLSAQRLCRRKGMRLPVIKDQLDYHKLFQLMKGDQKYWIALMKPASTDPVPYQWPESDTDVHFLEEHSNFTQFRHKGPSELCTINLIHEKRRIAIECLTADSNRRARFLCIQAC